MDLGLLDRVEGLVGGAAEHRGAVADDVGEQQLAHLAEDGLEREAEEDEREEECR